MAYAYERLQRLLKLKELACNKSTLTNWTLYLALFRCFPFEKKKLSVAPYKIKGEALRRIALKIKDLVSLRNTLGMSNMYLIPGLGLIQWGEH